MLSDSAVDIQNFEWAAGAPAGGFYEENFKKNKMGAFLERGAGHGGVAGWL
jgi:hypothetical protein